MTHWPGRCSLARSLASSIRRMRWSSLLRPPAPLPLSCRRCTRCLPVGLCIGRNAGTGESGVGSVSRVRCFPLLGVRPRSLGHLDGPVHCYDLPLKVIRLPLGGVGQGEAGVPSCARVPLCMTVREDQMGRISTQNSDYCFSVTIGRKSPTPPFFFWRYQVIQCRRNELKVLSSITNLAF